MPASQAGRRRFESGRPLQKPKGLRVSRNPLVASSDHPVTTGRSCASTDRRPLVIATKPSVRRTAFACCLLLLLFASAAAEQQASQSPLPSAPDWALIAGWDVYVKKG